MIFFHPYIATGTKTHIFYLRLFQMKTLALLKRLLAVKTTNDKILEAYLREESTSSASGDGIYYNKVDRTSSPPPPGTEITGTNVISKSAIFPGEDVTNLVLDTNDIGQTI